jgi:DNA-directed RNA polymerase specialized sigma24 family protein
MQDEEVVAAIVAGDPDGLAEAYDQYAAPLYAYCSVMLPSPGDAAGAVRDIFLIATSRLDRLRDPGKLRPWLHAVARNECHRRLSSAGVTPPPQRTPGDGVLPTVELPASLRGEVLRACADTTPAGRADRASAAHHAGTFGPTGFPRPIGSGAPRWWGQLRRHPRTAAAVATVAAVAVAGGLIAMLTIGGSHRAQASTAAGGGGLAGGSSGAPGTSGGPGALGAPGASGRATASGLPQASPAPGQPTPSVIALGGIISPAAPMSGGPSGGMPTPSASPSGTSSSPSPSPSPSTSSSPVRGILKATPDRLALTSTSGKAVSGKFILSALYGPVSNYVIEIPPAMTGKLKVSPAKGSLGAGGQVTVTVTAISKVAHNTHLTIDPGNLTVTVVLTLKP